MKRNLAARLAAYFLQSKLTPTLVLAIVLAGVLAVLVTPREENPQITMPAATIVTQYPGASSDEVERLVTQRGERVLREVPGIEHVYSQSLQNVSIITVLFHVGDDPTKSFVDLYDQVFAHLDQLPPGASQPQITPLSVDDIPILVLTLHGEHYDRGQLTSAAQRLIDAIEPIDGVSAVTTYGALPRQVNVTMDPVRLAAYGLSAAAVGKAIGATNVTQPAGPLRAGATETQVQAGTPFTSAAQVSQLIVSVQNARPVTLGDVADVQMGYAPEEQMSRFGTRDGSGDSVSIAIAKKPGTNAVNVAGRVLAKLQTQQMPPGIAVAVTRNYGDKANLAVNELIERLAEAIVIVVALLLLTLGWRQAIVVATAIPLTLFVTLSVGMLAHQSINRITLFALILALGLLVDDAIVLVENIHRHYASDERASRAETTIRAVGEIGSPTTLATLTVVLSFLPMLFVTGMMGPYMRPIPINVPVAMLASLLIAFTITPWATYRLLGAAKMKAAHGAPRWVRPFERALTSLLDNARNGRRFLAALAVAFIVALSLPLLTLVQFRMLPRANETTFLISVDAPPASTVAQTMRIAQAVSSQLAQSREVTTYEITAGTNSVPDLSSLLEGTVFRNAANQADIRVNLLPKKERRVQSAVLVRELRPKLQEIAARYGATLRILQTPPGPPVRDTIFAKIYGPDIETRRVIAARLMTFFQRERGVVDVDSTFKPLPAQLTVTVDNVKAAVAGVDVADVAQTLTMALRGSTVSILHAATDPNPIGVFVRFAPQYREDPAAFGSIGIPSRTGGMVPLSTIATVRAGEAQQPLYRDDNEESSYVYAEMAGRSSTYAVIDAMIDLVKHPLPPGYRIVWDGEWHMTATVFADLGRAMLVAFILIYVVLVARFRSFRTPLVVLAAVPLAMIGIMPGFAILAPAGVYFSATAMIGLIALIGIVVRNSIILIEFIEDKVREGLPLREALVESAGVRTRPIFLTAAAGVLSSIVIATDPVWSGLAWALVFGMTASAVLSVLAIPVLYAAVAPARAARPAPAAGVGTGMRTIVAFPELDGFVTETTTLPRVFQGESVMLDLDLFRGEGEGVDAVAHVEGAFRVESASLDVQGAYGELQGLQRVTLRSLQTPPVWKLLENA